MGGRTGGAARARAPGPGERAPLAAPSASRTLRATGYEPPAASP